MAKKKPKVKEKLVEDDDFEPVTKPKKRLADEDADEDDGGPPKARNDVYFGLTLITTLLLIGAAALLYFDQEDLKSGPNAGFNPPEIKAGSLGFRATAGKQ
jgi:hypothetical protein